MLAVIWCKLCNQRSLLNPDNISRIIALTMANITGACPVDKPATHSQATDISSVRGFSAVKTSDVWIVPMYETARCHNPKHRRMCELLQR